MPETPYDEKFFEVNRRGGRQAANMVVPIVLELLAPRSVCDVGCGAGSWLAVFKEQGVEDVVGVDGDYVPPAQLDIPAEQFLARDLAAGLELERRFDLAMSLEVAEHLPPEAGSGFVDTLANLAPAVLFSAAIPNQGGRNHVNEQWPDYWEGEFGRSDYVAVDCIRPRIWKRPGVHFWYRQNIILFVSRELLDGRPPLKEEYERSRSRPLSVVHPRMLELAATRSARRFAQLEQQRESGEITQQAFDEQRDALVEELTRKGREVS
jgi:SAM-dependent methyltransferase